MIYYIFYYNPENPGVFKKICSKIEILKNLGVKIEGVCVVSNEELSQFSTELPYINIWVSDKEKKSKLIPIFKNRFLGWVNAYFNEKRQAAQIQKILEQFPADQYIMRLGWGNRALYQLIKKYPHKIIWERNSITEDEIKIAIGGYKSFWKSAPWKSYFIFSNRYYTPKILNFSRHVVAVTHEILNDLMRTAHCKGTVISNGIDVKQYPLANQTELNEKVNFVMLLGNEAPWHGLDLLLNSLHDGISGTAHFHIVGNVQKKREHSALTYYPKKNKEELDDFFKLLLNPVGIGSLALYRNNLKEACPLKVREYLARGIPVVYNYIDSDLSTDPLFSGRFCIELQKNINWHDVIKKYRRIQQEYSFSEKIRAWSLENIDNNLKMLKYKKITSDTLDNN